MPKGAKVVKATKNSIMASYSPAQTSEAAEAQLSTGKPTAELCELRRRTVIPCTLPPQVHHLKTHRES